MDSYDITFNRLLERYYGFLINKYTWAISRARDKCYVNKLYSLEAAFRSKPDTGIPFKSALINSFDYYYKLGDSLKPFFEKIPSLREEHLERMKREDKSEGDVQVFYYKNWFFKLLRIRKKVEFTKDYTWDREFLLEADESEIVKYLVRYVAYNQFHEFLESQNIANPVSEGSKSKELLIKKIKRDKDDDKTSLNLEQTALFIYYLKRSNIILDDNILPKTVAAEAFEILTGYSKNTLRIALSNLPDTMPNLDSLQKALQQLLDMIDKKRKTHRNFLD